MPKFIIEGRKPLKGEIETNGAKNSALKIIAAALLTEEETIINNVPDIEDIRQLLEIIRDIGAKVEKIGSRRYKILADNISTINLSPELVPKLRSSVMLVGPILARIGEVTMPHPGGCAIGRRPIDIFIDGFKAMGVEVRDEPNFYRFKARKLKGAKFVFPQISVTATETLMMTAVLAEGKTVFINAACEPEIPALADYLNSCGAKITGAGTPIMTIEGVKKISGGIFNVIPDRIEAGSFIIMAAAAKGDITVRNCNPNHLEVPLFLLQKMGVKFERGEDYVHILPYKNHLKAVNVTTHEYPGFATDLQAPMTLLLTQAAGTSLVHETIFEGRLFYIDMLNRMGANIILCDPHRAIVNGPTPLRAKPVESPDLRAGIAMVIAGLIAEGKTEISNIYQINRGYENLENKLNNIGASIRRKED